ncbi:unnamed protein product [Clonostachys solani]|uniref:Uncharacterized protein n=1 Tax=Clonostachys solani TaxID=160281 RepID=A0A9N9ZJ31_9HYPO|nr:unnamed protein product [Clonostachys solani]
MLLASISDPGLGVERVDFNLVDDGPYSGVGLLDCFHELLNLATNSPRQARLFAAVGTVQQEQVDVAQAARLDRLGDGALDGIVRGLVVGELGGVEDVLAAQTLGVLRPKQEVLDGQAGLALVVVHLRAVEAAVAQGEGGSYRVSGFPAAHLVEAQLDPGHGDGGIGKGGFGFDGNNGEPVGKTGKCRQRHGERGDVERWCGAEAE